MRTDQQYGNPEFLKTLHLRSFCLTRVLTSR
jgi:hypothetical protein